MMDASAESQTSRAPVRQAELAGWGRLPRRSSAVVAPRDEAELRALVLSGLPVIARGGGRAYGDAALGAEGGVVLSMRRFDHLLSLDETGLLVAEAGVVLGDLVRAMLPRGWFVRVSPGTQFPTLGGLVAADVHGKNHHIEGAFSSAVEWVDLMGADGQVSRVSREADPELFWATVGGMGLTGVILRMALRLMPVETGYILEETVASETLADGMAAFRAAESRADAPPYSVAWIDALTAPPALGRSLLLLGRHAGRVELDARAAADPYALAPRRRVTVPLDAPGWLLGPLSMRAFNRRHWAKGLRQAGGGPRLTPWEAYFYPLDAIDGWNRLYGRRGFVQMQCVLPEEGAEAALSEMLAASAKAGLGYLGVLKRFGAAGEGLLSFPRPGWTLALDIPGHTAGLALSDRLEAIAAAAGGGFYLAKDARLPRARFDQAEPRAARFRSFRAERGLGARFASAQSERLGL